MNCRNTVEYFKVKRRMTGSYADEVTNCACEIPCSECALYSGNGKYDLPCDLFEMIYPEIAVSLVEKWAETHPVKTLLDDLLEHYPHFKLDANGVPAACPRVFGYEVCANFGCDECCEKGLNELCWKNELR